MLVSTTLVGAICSGSPHQVPLWGGRCLRGPPPQMVLCSDGSLCGMCCMSLYLGLIIVFGLLILCVTTHAFSVVVLLGRRVTSIVVFFSKH
jgi:hypothetical protein